jgi:hypothetical protein
VQKKGKKMNVSDGKVYKIKNKSPVSDLREFWCGGRMNYFSLR